MYKLVRKPCQVSRLIIMSLTTKEYVEKHQRTVRKRLSHFSTILQSRAFIHDESKLQEPEYSLWKQMDEEPRYPYGTKEYISKLDRWQHLFRMHWNDSRNRHHPEHFTNPITEMDLMDMIEMLCDWLGYKEVLSYTEASKLVDSQCKRFNFPDEFRYLLLNTLTNYFVTFGGISSAVDDENRKANEIIKGIEPGSVIDILV